jgi:hypothetical protein
MGKLSLVVFLLLLTQVMILLPQFQLGCILRLWLSFYVHPEGEQ